MALFVLTVGLLAAGQMLYASLSTMSLARSKGNAAIVAQDKLEYLSDLFSRNPNHPDVADGWHLPQQVQITNPSDNSVLNRFNVAWEVSAVTDPRDKTRRSKRVLVNVVPIRTADTAANPKRGQNKILSVTQIVSPSQPE